jgi:NADH dehydrogenase
VEEEERKELTTFVIVGAGPTGVELAGALADLAHRTPPVEYPHLRAGLARFVLVEGGPRVLPTYPPDLSAAAERQLRELGVEVRTNARVTHLDDRHVAIGDECIAARTVLWAAGISASPLTKQLGVPLDPHGRVEVEPDLRVPGSSSIFAIGDTATVTSKGALVPGVAPAAMQEGRHAAKNIVLLVAGRPTLPFEYWNKGTISIIGRHRAVADFGKFHLSGFLAAFAYFFVHLFFLASIRRRLVVLIDWTWSYFSRSRSARILTETAQGERIRIQRHAHA